MIENLSTLLQALYASGELQGYICSILPTDDLKPGWVEQGLAFKALRGSLSTKTNQTRYVQPTERIVRLMYDREMDAYQATGIAIVGRQGLSTEKMLVLLGDDTKRNSSKFSASLWTKTEFPLGFMSLFGKFLLGTSSVTTFEEPNIDYIEQFREDSSDGLIREAIILPIPKDLGNKTSWLKNALGKSNGDANGPLFSFGSLKETHSFALLFSKTLSDSESILPAKDFLFASILVKSSSIEVVLWDVKRAIASFVVFNQVSWEEITWKYLLPLWATSNDRLDLHSEKLRKLVDLEDASIKTRKSDVAFKSKNEEIKSLHARIEQIEEYLSKIDTEKIARQVSLLEKRSESVRLAVNRIGELEKTLKEVSTKDELDSSSLDLLQNRLQMTIERMEALSEKLGELETRITAITNPSSEE